MDLRTLTTLYSLIPGAPGAQNVHKMWTPGYWNNIANGFLNSRNRPMPSTSKYPSAPKPIPNAPVTNGISSQIKPIPNAPANKGISSWVKPIPNAPANRGISSWIEPIPNAPVNSSSNYHPQATLSDIGAWQRKNAPSNQKTPNSPIGNNTNWNSLYTNYNKYRDIINNGRQDWSNKERNMEFDMNSAREQWNIEERKPYNLEDGYRQWLKGERIRF